MLSTISTDLTLRRDVQFDQEFQCWVNAERTQRFDLSEYSAFDFVIEGHDANGKELKLVFPQDGDRVIIDIAEGAIQVSIAPNLLAPLSDTAKWYLRWMAPGGIPEIPFDGQLIFEEV